MPRLAPASGQTGMARRGEVHSVAEHAVGSRLDVWALGG